ncbi:GMP/IMP nucleotidase [Pseudoteredinibacter isoporae]
MMSNSPQVLVDWEQIDTVLLDMDGTLLDLHFDNYFWLHHLPRRYVDTHQVSMEAATEKLHGMFETYAGKLEWYCLEHWSNALELDIRALKEEVQERIATRPYAIEFLQRLRALNKKLVLITNAHPQSLSLKLDITAIDQWLDVVISSHEYRQPKEQQAFWHCLQEQEQFDPARTLFIDDTVRILDSAAQYGIKHLLCIHQPDSQQARRVDDYPAIDHFDEIMPPL